MKKDKVKALFVDVDSGDELPDVKFLSEIEVGYSDSVDDPIFFSDVETVTTNSLSPFNAGFIKNGVGKGFFNADQLILRITDDEVDRWIKSFERLGFIGVDPDALIDADVLEVLGWVDRFICLRNPWGDLLEKMLGRDLLIYDVFIDANKFLDDEIEDFFYKKIQPSVVGQLRSRSVLRVMVSTKPVGVDKAIPYLKDLFRLICFNSNLVSGRAIEILLWSGPFSKNFRYPALIVLTSILSRIMKVRVVYSFLTAMPREVYFSKIASCHVLLAQGRGGLGAINEFAKNGALIVFPKGSLNEQVFVGLDGPFFMSANPESNVFVKAISLLKDGGFEDWMDKNRRENKDSFLTMQRKTKDAISRIYC